MTKSCEGTLKSPPKSFKLGHIASAFVTLMLRGIADAVEVEAREEISPKAADYNCRQTRSQREVSAKWQQHNSQGLGGVHHTHVMGFSKTQTLIWWVKMNTGTDSN